MGWAESMTVFCAGSETARDGIDSLSKNPNLKSHPLENTMMPAQLPKSNPKRYQTIKSAFLPMKTFAAESASDEDLPDLAIPANLERWVQLAECYVDDFIGLIQTDSIEKLRHFTRAILHGIESVFPN